MGRLDGTNSLNVRGGPTRGCMGGSESEDGRSAERLQAIFEHAFDAIVVADDEGRYVDANPAACELFGLEREELLGRRIEEFADPEYDYEAAWARFQSESDRTGLFPLRRPDGEVRLVEYSASREIQTGEHLSILRDVTERVEQERALAEQLERLDEFATTVSHDLRNPLNLAMAKLEFYRETRNDDHYDDAVAALESIDRITGELLTLARRADERGEHTEFSLGEIAREVWAETDTREATLEVVGDRTIRANRGQVHLLLSNLVRNAVGHGGYDVTVRVGPVESDDGSGGFYVEDTGPGIPAEDRDRVFESGYTTGYGGSGVGLTIVQRVADAHDWSVEVGESDEGGARFTFRGRKT